MSPIAASDVPALALDLLAPANADLPPATPNWNLQANVIIAEPFVPGAKPDAMLGDGQPGTPVGAGKDKAKDGKAGGAKEVKLLRPMLIDSWYPSNPTCQHIERVLGLRAGHD